MSSEYTNAFEFSSCYNCNSCIDDLKDYKKNGLHVCDFIFVNKMMKYEIYCFDCINIMTCDIHNLFKCKCQYNTICNELMCENHFKDWDLFCHLHKEACSFISKKISCQTRTDFEYHGKGRESFQEFMKCSNLPEELKFIIYNYYEEFGNGGCVKHSAVDW